MKNTSFIQLFIAGNLLAATLLTGCEKSDADISAPIRLANLSEVLQSNSSFTKAALNRSGLAQTLSGPESMTLFFPQDEAFRQAGFINEESLTEADATAIASILKYHLLKGEQKAAVLSAGQVATVQGKNVTIDKTSGITLTGAGNLAGSATVTASDIQAGNGMVHTINRLLLPDARSLTTIATTNGIFDILEAALTRANLTGVLNGTTAYTLFAPTDDAFISYLGIPTKDPAGKDRSRADIQKDAIAQINTLSVSELTTLLNYHLITGSKPSSGLASGELTTANGTKLTLSVDAQSKAVSLTGNGNATASTVVQKDVAATNGFVHIVNQVLIP